MEQPRRQRRLRPGRGRPQLQQYKRRGQNGANNSVVQKFWTPSGWSSTWENLGGGTTVAPSISSRSSTSLDLFIRGGAGDLNWKHFNTTNGWGGWVGLGGSLGSGPSAVSRSSNRINVVAKNGSNSNVIQKYYLNGSWSGWENLGGGTGFEPGIASWGSNRLDIVIRGGGGDINHKFFNGSSWSGWSSLGGSIKTGPEAVGGQW